MRSLTLLLILILGGLQYKLWFGDGGVSELKKVENALVIQEDKNQKLVGKNKALESDIHELKSGDQALEEQARNELGMVKDGETYYQFAD